MIDPSDDLGTAKAPIKVVACIPVFGRLPLLHHTITRLLKKNHVDHVICVGGNEERYTCEKAGAHFITHQNKPLGKKWNTAFQEAKQFKPDACLFVGSSDFISDNWTQTIYPYLDRYDLVGLPDCFFADIKLIEQWKEYRVVYWPGYVGHRKNESIGIGRMVSRSALERLNWMPFDNNLNSSLDGSMFNKIANRYLLKTDKCFSLSISTNQWENLHKFEDHWSGKLKSEHVTSVQSFLEDNFPEVLKVF